MKTAAAVIIVLALAGVFSKDKKKHEPPPAPVSAPVYESFECNDPRSTPFDEAAKQRILKFGLEKKNAAVSDQLMNDVAHYIVVYSTFNCVEPELAAALIARESRYNPRAVSSTGAKGLGQLVDSTARWLGVSDSFDVQQNLRGSTKYLNMLLHKWEGHPEQTAMALASYLVGPTKVEQEGISRSSRAYINDILRYREEIKGM